jgi:hypothetical protein
VVRLAPQRGGQGTTKDTENGVVGGEWKLLAGLGKSDLMQRTVSSIILPIAVLALLATSTPAWAANTVCLGEAISSRAISHGGKGDSAISPNGDDCFFSVESPIGRQIEKVCPIRDLHSSDQPGPICRVEAVVSNRIIRRVISIRKLDKP